MYRPSKLSLMCCHSHVLWNVCVPAFAYPHLAPAILVSPSMHTSTTPQTSLRTHLHIQSPCRAHPLGACWPLTALLTAGQPVYTASRPWKPCGLPGVYRHHVTYIHAGPFYACSVDDCDPPIPVPLLPGSPFGPARLYLHPAVYIPAGPLVATLSLQRKSLRACWSILPPCGTHPCGPARH